MPELPDVEGFRRVLARHAVGKPIRRVEVRDRGVLRGASAPQLARALRGRCFRQPARHGKWLIARTNARAVLLFHFGMTGALWWRRRGQSERAYDRIVFAMGPGELRYNDLRKLHGVRLASEAEVERVLARLGPDALAISRRDFDERLSRRTSGVKAALMDQTVIAGLGNLLVDEILWRSRVHPASPVKPQYFPTIFQTMKRVLRAALPTGRVPPRVTWFAGRTSVWCPRCQRRNRA